MLTGNKKDNVTIIYTPWANLRKDASMATGQVSFKEPKKVCICAVLARFSLMYIPAVEFLSHPLISFPFPC